MAGQVSPGIVLRERDLTAQTIVNQQANSAALVGSFAKGPVGVITNIATEKELLDTFGAPNNNNYEDWFAAATFLSYGGQLQIVRIDDITLKNGTTEVGSTTTDATKLNVANAGSFTSGDYVKVDDEFFVIGTVTTGGSDSLLVTSRGQLGSTGSPVTHANGATVTKWNYAVAGTTTVVNETVDATETVFNLTLATNFTVGSYFRLSNSGANSNGVTEIVRITAVDGNEVVVTRAQLGTTAAGQPGATITATLLTFAATATTTTLTTAFPVVTTAGVTAPLIKSYNNYLANYSSYAWKFAARTPGTWANNLKVVTIDGGVATYSEETVYGTTKWTTIAGDPGGSNDMHIAVLDANNNVLETFLYVSRLSNAKDDQGASTYYVDVIASKSSYIYAGTVSPAAGNATLTLSAGIDAYTTNVSTITTAFDLFADTEEISLDFVLAGGSLSILADNVTKAQKAVSIADTRKDCVAFVSPHKGFVSVSSSSSQRDDIIAFFDQIGSSSYAVFDSGYKYIYDKYNDTYRYIPCCGDVAGLCVQVSATSEDWVSPAGVNRGNIKNAVKLAYVPTKTDRDKLYQKRINSITSFAGQGIILFGDKTALAAPSAFDRINVRRLFVAIEKRIGNLGKSVLFELNDATTRASFASAANSYLSEIKSKRGVTDYLVVCDESNNTGDVIDRNEFVAEIYVKPTRSINYITITFVATRTGVSFSEVSGR
jgi:hypothetical protein